MRLPPDTRILIVGAGPAGMWAATELLSRGFDVTVLERADRVGGKCLSYNADGYVYDLGANLTTPRYERIRDLARDLSVPMRRTASRRVVDVTGAPAPKASWTQRQALPVLAALYKLLRRLTGIDRVGYADLGLGVHQPFRRWLQSRCLGSMERLFEVLFTSYGYGHAMDLPAIYALKFFDPIHLDAAISVALGRPVEFTTEFSTGFGSLWERLNRSVNAITGVTGLQVSRSPGGVQARWHAQGATHVERFDELILACPLQATSEFLDLRPEERVLFSGIRTFEYYVTVAELSGVDPVSTYLAPYASKIHPGQPTVYYPPVGAAPNHFVFYAYGGPGVTEREVRDNITRAVESKAIGGKVKRFLTTKRWDYFPHLPETSDLFYDAVNYRQGRDRTWYTGEVLSFTLVEEVARHAEWVSGEIADRYSVR